MSSEPQELSQVSPTVLVVDDEKNIRRTLRMVLEGEGYEVDEAGAVRVHSSSVRGFAQLPVTVKKV